MIQTDLYAVVFYLDTYIITTSILMRFSPYRQCAHLHLYILLWINVSVHLNSTPWRFRTYTLHYVSIGQDSVEHSSDKRQCHTTHNSSRRVDPSHYAREATCYSREPWIARVIASGENGPTYMTISRPISRQVASADGAPTGPAMRLLIHHRPVRPNENIFTRANGTIWIGPTKVRLNYVLDRAQPTFRGPWDSWKSRL